MLFGEFVRRLNKEAKVWRLEPGQFARLGATAFRGQRTRKDGDGDKDEDESKTLQAQCV